jgi:hypothetical protein
MITAVPANDKNQSQQTARLASKSIVIRDFYLPEKAYVLEINEIGNSYKVVPCQKIDRLNGFGVQSVVNMNDKVAAYFCSEAVDTTKAPAYESSLFFAINAKIYCLHDGSTKVTLSKRLFSRSLKVHHVLSGDSVHSYSWPFYRQLLPRIFGDPFNYVSNDYFEEFYKLGKFYHPNYFTTKLIAT